MKKNLKNNKLPDKIIRAIYGNRIQEIKNWINKEGVNILDSDGRNIVMHSIIANNANILKIALEHQEDPNIKGHDGRYPLYHAAQKNFASLAAIILKYGAIINFEDNYGNTPLWRAVFFL
nr:ankyrin repeat domain-containing protein [Pedobacter sp. ASV2]